jgi:hypothetical protein
MTTQHQGPSGKTFIFGAIIAASAWLGGTAAAQPGPSASEASSHPVAAPPAPAPIASQAQPHRAYRGILGDSQYRSPGLAVALSLTPLPVDFGNLYAENLGWGIVYTAFELSLMAPMMWLAGGHMDHGRDNTRSWSDSERNAMFGLAGGYVLVKLAAGLHAGYAARAFNRESSANGLAFVAPTPGGALVTWGNTF